MSKMSVADVPKTDLYIFHGESFLRKKKIFSEPSENFIGGY